MNDEPGERDGGEESEAREPHEQPQPPERATPSLWAYRGSIAALVLGSFLALFLVLRPPESASRAEPLRATSTPASTPEPEPPPPTTTPTTTPVAATPVAATPIAATPIATPEPTPIATPVPTVIEYTVVEGDTLLGIALDFDVTLDEVLELNPGLEPEALQIGQIILVPRR